MYPASQPAGFATDVMGISRRVLHLAEVLPNRGKHEALAAPDTGFDAKAHLLELGPDFQADAAFAGVDQDRNGRAGAEEVRYFGDRGFDRLKGIVA